MSVAAGPRVSTIPRVPEVCAVVVTHDRRDLLRECLAAIAAQTRPVERTIVVDNASTDGTGEMLASEFPDVEVVRLERNEGGAGGFHHGLAHAARGQAEWLWSMDDDTIPTPTALEELLAGLDRVADLPAPALLASRVLWMDGELHPMNLPWPRWGDKWLEVRSVEQRLVAIRAISYVSILIRRESLVRHGLPRTHYFIWGDDIEFTARLLRDEVGYLVPQSVVHHKTVHPHPASRSTGPRYYFDVRNKLFMLRGSVWRPTERFWLALLTLKGIREYLEHNSWRGGSVPTVLRGIRDGLLRPEPHTEIRVRP